MKDEAIVVLASGDPLFYGIGSLMIKRLGEENVIIYPNVSTVSTAFARIKEPWQDATVISLHGKSGFRSLLKALEKNNTVVALTDPRNHPGELAHFLLNRRFADLKMCILEQLGTENEKVRWFDLETAANKTFKEPNVVIFKRNTTVADNHSYQFPGLPEIIQDSEQFFRKELARIGYGDKLVVLPKGPDHLTVAWEKIIRPLA